VLLLLGVVRCLLLRGVAFANVNDYPPGYYIYQAFDVPSTSMDCGNQTPS